MRFRTAFLPIILAIAPAQFLMIQEPLLAQSTSTGASRWIQSLRRREELLEKSDLASAETVARKYVAEHANSPEGHFLLGLIFFREVQSQARAGGEYLAPGDLPSTAIDSKARDRKNSRVARRFYRWRKIR